MVASQLGDRIIIGICLIVIPKDKRTVFAHFYYHFFGSSYRFKPNL